MAIDEAEIIARYVGSVPAELDAGAAPAAAVAARVHAVGDAFGVQAQGRKFPPVERAPELSLSGVARRVAQMPPRAQAERIFGLSSTGSSAACLSRLRHSVQACVARPVASSAT